MTSIEQLREMGLALKKATEEMNRETIRIKKLYEEDKNVLFRNFNKDLYEIYKLMNELEIKNGIVYADTGLKSKDTNKSIFIQIRTDCWGYDLDCGDLKDMPYNAYRVSGHYLVDYTEENLYRKETNAFGHDFYIYNTDLFVELLNIWENIKNNVLISLQNQIADIMVRKSELAISNYKNAKTLLNY